ncbi:Alpha/Beta hydrolase protein [Dactylonectria estremocensis]|uniref:Alpha/Beta hydrolase protein n=1 Tax=Dactylonectria estremocensis TaxID=1079267 RepID=A0A9P9J3V7_9HYPO|nr:Alpha/Beta hydrolase protein [Dactylonectria estremocensis]
MDKNPLRVQSAPAGKSPKPTPLVLIHDGGGTTFGYFSLGKLHRDVWAIHNPRFFTAAPWEGGMDEMARHYIALIETIDLSGPILLGGWSLGGYLSIVMARILADMPSPKFTVAGMLMIDSPYHVAMNRFPGAGADPDFSKLPDLVRKSLNNCDQLLQNWELPQWDGPALGGRTVTLGVGGEKHQVEDGNILYKSLTEGWQNVEAQRFHQDAGESAPAGDGPPPTVMVRCVGYAKTKTPSDKSCFVDLYRDERFLGWEGTYPSFIKASMDTDTNHYGVFDFKHVSKLTIQLNEGLGILETLKGA